ncbi:MFS transporter [Mycobacteroides abscessus]|uniref:Transmembrane efflux protein n=7 Tax=Bacteria TaxID=2 RepID=B1MK62_MYCA9|nr:MFS transporter [Mycobacteroides abscessus]ALM18667.1 MFS transporter [Mycobacteroides abscessus]AMU32914.1 MFS transporter [Mycobacteroides abscessus]AMU47713.1 MFS transporter [Mycobacteroides abscessus]AMU52753.1 MFS transporter [Mycobacteroides abscessus]ANO01079.1 MFS transporter [Mycobacteroides abscessus]
MLLSPPTAPAPPRAERGRWYALSVACLIEMLLVINSSIVAAALPATQAALRFTNSDRQWLITAYVLTLGGLLLLGGRVADMVGLRSAMIIGLSGFAIASFVGGSATNFGELVASRISQGVFGALLAPAAMSLVANSFRGSTAERHAFGIFGAVIGAASTAGLLVGGVLTQLLVWRWVMYISVLMTMTALAGTLAFVRKYPVGQRSKLDLFGSLTVTLGLFAIVFGFSRAEVRGWTASIAILSFITGLTLIGVFIRHQQRSKNPLLPLRVVCDRTRGAAFLAMFFASAGLFGVVLSLLYYLQRCLHLAPLWAGVAFLPFSATVVFASTLGNSFILPRLDGRTVLIAGGVTSAFGLLMLSHIDSHANYYTAILPGLVIGGFGKGLIFGASTHGAATGIRPEESGIASATVNVMHHVGGSLGAALLSSVVASTATFFLARHASSDQAAAAGYSAAFWVSAASCLAAAAIALVIRPADGNSRTAPVLRGKCCTARD